MSAFTEGASTKTEFDDIVKTFQGFKNELTELQADPDATGTIFTIFEGVGAQAKMFGINADTAETKTTELLNAFTKIQSKAKTLKSDLQTLNAVTQKIGKSKSTSGAAMEAFLDQQQKSNTLQLAFNADKLIQYRLLSDSVGRNNLINEAEKERNALLAKRMSTMEMLLTTEQTSLKISLDYLRTNQKIGLQAEEILKVERQLKNLREGRGSAESPLEIYKAQVKAAKIVLENKKNEKKIEDAQAANRYNTILENNIELSRGSSAEKKQYGAIVKEAYKKYLLDLKSTKANVAGQQKVLALVTAQGTESEDMFTAAVSLMSILGTTTDTLGTRFTILSIQMTPFINQLKALGTEGNLAGIAIEKLMALGNGLLNFKTNVKVLSDKMVESRTQVGDTFLTKMLGTANPDTIATTIAGLATMGEAFGAMGAIIEMEAAQRTAAIDKAIAQEKRLGGSSESSLKKIAQMESKRESIKRKAFEKQKKMQVAETIMNTASAAMTALTTFAGVPPLAFAMAGMITAIGLKQVSIIRSQQYDGGGTAPSAPSSISVGKRDNKVDVSKGATSGETSLM